MGILVLGIFLPICFSGGKAKVQLDNPSPPSWKDSQRAAATTTSSHDFLLVDTEQEPSMSSRDVSEAGWVCGSSSRVPSSQAQVPEFKPQYCQKKERKKERKVSL
jgi:hypothetical protein